MPVSSSDTVCKGADSQIHGMNQKVVFGIAIARWATWQGRPR